MFFRKIQVLLQHEDNHLDYFYPHPGDDLYKFAQEKCQNKDILITLNKKPCFPNETIKQIQERFQGQELIIQVHSLSKVLDCYFESSQLSKECQKLQSKVKEQSEQIQQMEFVSRSTQNVFQNELYILQAVVASLENNTNNLKPLEHVQFIQIAPDQQIQLVDDCLDYLIKQKRIEAERLTEKKRNLQSQINSRFIHDYKICVFCNQMIRSGRTYLNCHHYYHEECLEELITYQVLKYQRKITCICNAQINKSQLRLLSPKAREKCLNQISQLELLYIKSSGTHRFQGCKKFGCSFIFVCENNTQPYCPQCN